MDISQIIIKPYHTEKTYRLRNGSGNSVITFLVNDAATKHSIAVAFEAIYEIKPVKINIVKRQPSKMRTGTMKPGIRKAKKIAYITLPAGLDIAVSEEDIQNAAKANGQVVVEDTPVSELKEIKE